MKVGRQFREQKIFLTSTFCLPGGHETEHCTCFIIVIMTSKRLPAPNEIRLENLPVKIHNSSLDTSHSARNLGFIFDEHLTFSNQITSLSLRSLLLQYHIRQHHCIRSYFDSSTASTIVTSIVYSKLAYFNSLYYKSQLSCLQHIQNALARTVVKAPKSCHITPILRFLHWLRITECIGYKFLSLSSKVLTTTQPS